MLAFRVRHPGDSEGAVEQIPIPVPKRGEALVRVLRAGICNTDLEIMKGYMGFSGVLGHEFVGIVEQFAEDGVPEQQRRRLAGKRVVGDINLACAECSVCARRNDRSRNHCPTRTVLGILAKDGTFAEYLTLPVVNLHLVPDGVTDEQAVFCEPLAAACRVVEQGLARNSDDGSFGEIAILGDGKLGLMVAEVLGREHIRWMAASTTSSSTACKIVPAPILFGKHAHKLAFVKSSGVECRLVSELYDKDKSNNTVSAEYMGKFDVVVDATGSPSGLSLASSMCRPMGTLVLKSTCADGEAFNAAPFVINELRVVGSRCGPFPEALRLLAITDDKDLNKKKGEEPKAPTASNCCSAVGMKRRVFAFAALACGLSLGAVGRLLLGKPFSSLAITKSAAIATVCGLAAVALNHKEASTSSPAMASLRVEKYVTKCFPLKRADEAIKFAAERSTMKVQLICGD